VPLYVWYAAGVRDLSPNCAGQGRATALNVPRGQLATAVTLPGSTLTLIEARCLRPAARAEPAARRWRVLSAIWQCSVMTDGPPRVTIVSSRYGGIYEPGAGVAFACWPDEIPPDWNADDVTCLEFFTERRGEIGGGATPQEAYEDLLRRLDQRRRSLS
jgi:hypothetical protein